MTRQEAKEILSVFRPGTEDERDPLFAEALALVETDPQLKTWFRESIAFDRGVRMELSRSAAPTDLRERILADAKTVRPAIWHQRVAPWQIAAAAAVLVLFAAGGVWLADRQPTFADFRREIIDQTWGPVPHHHYKTDDLNALRRYLASRDVRTDFDLPPTLAASEIRGCSIAEWRGKKFPVLCFNSNGQHLHLLVAPQSSFTDTPEHLPVLDQWAAWRTATWMKDGNAYVLTGLSTSTFVKKFRKARQWDWEG